MPQPNQLLRESSAVSEVAGAPLGDRRRGARHEDILARLSAQPDASIPDAMRTEAALEAYYRFMRNDAVDHAAMLEPHFEKTRGRAEAIGRVLVIHDTSEFGFTVHDEPARKNLAEPAQGHQCFSWHPALVLAADGTRAPLGLIASRPFAHKGDLPDEEAREFWAERDGLFDNEMSRWLEGVEAAEARLEDATRPIHVMDRECDDYGLMSRMREADYSFVIRMCYARNVSDGPLRDDYRKLADALGDEPWEDDQREVLLSARPARKTGKNHTPRRARKVRLKARSTTVELRRPKRALSPDASGTLAVRVVEVLEVDPPAGAEPVRWVLATTEPVDDAEAIWEVVDHYRARWTIEEYFKALKTGAAYKELQHKSAKTLLTALAAKAVVAWNLLRLRHLGRHMPQMDAEEVLDPVQIAILRQKRPNKLPEDATAADAMYAVAGMGGHLKRNGPPGWLVLGRGWEHLAELTEGFRLAQRLAERSDLS